MTRRDADLRDFTCGRCLHRSLALVIGIGPGGQVARANATLTLSLARCPACGRRDPVAVARFWTRLAAAELGSVLFLWGVGGGLYLLLDEPLFAWVFVPIGVLATPVIAWQESWKWTTVDRRVAFVEASFIARSEALSPPASLQPGR